MQKHRKNYESIKILTKYYVVNVVINAAAVKFGQGLSPARKLVLA